MKMTSLRIEISDLAWLQAHSLLEQLGFIHAQRSPERAQGLFYLEGFFDRPRRGSAAGHFFDLDLLKSSKDLNPSETELMGLVFWKPLTSDALNDLKVKLADWPDLHFLILGHQAWDYVAFLKQLSSLGVMPAQITLLGTEVFNRPLWMRSFSEFKKKNGPQYSYYLAHQLYRQNLTEKSSQTERVRMPYFLIAVMRFILTPYNEILKGIQWLKISNFIWMKRAFELVDFLTYIFGFAIKQIFLHILFKLYGLGVDLSNLMIRVSRIHTVRLYFLVRHFILRTLTLQRIYGIRLGYFLRHILLMSAYKTYGLLVDSYFKLLFFCTRILPWPIYKIYWFCEFQYHKRVKKWLAN